MARNPNLKPRIAERETVVDRDASGDDGGGGTGGGGEAAPDAQLVNPADVAAGEPVPDTAPKRRGRKPGSGGRKTAKKEASLGVDDVKFGLILLHGVAANAFQAPELALTEPQADAYAKALHHVSTFYDLDVAPKYAAWGMLATVAGGIYFEKIAALSNRRRLEKQKPRLAVAPQPSANGVGIGAAP